VTKPLRKILYRRAYPPASRSPRTRHAIPPRQARANRMRRSSLEARRLGPMWPRLQRGQGRMRCLHSTSPPRRLLLPRDPHAVRPMLQPRRDSPCWDRASARSALPSQRMRKVNFHSWSLRAPADFTAPMPSISQHRARALRMSGQMRLPLVLPSSRPLDRIVRRCAQP
jgi:hypothetical protein